MAPKTHSLRKGLWHLLLFKCSILLTTFYKRLEIQSERALITDLSRYSLGEHKSCEILDLKIECILNLG